MEEKEAPANIFPELKDVVELSKTYYVVFEFGSEGKTEVRDVVRCSYLLNI
jgi:hypothetical protein